MRVERHDDVIDEERVGLLRPLDRRPQTWTEIGYDGIVDCDAWLYGEIVNPVRSKVVSQPIEGVAAKIEVAAIEGAPGIGCGIEREVEQAHHALGKGHHVHRGSSELGFVTTDVFTLQAENEGVLARYRHC